MILRAFFRLQHRASLAGDGLSPGSSLRAVTFSLP
nr:MAG TPA: hypothetical protein [Bacteriophage sp.]DAM13085.1 MAG TPA: hypothetical protein [Caudoviricetes sp.]DAR41590.1 MAG TPA: hypothetical protein [Caudoviricetes sp.]DAV79782.1 MAG TPA: hypothetical protein [Caudoviricetes sp.]